MISEQLLIFLREVKEQPYDDTPRLILADWLQDQDDPRGELIHLQVMRSRLAEDDPRYKEILRRERRLLGANALNWLGPFVDLASAWDFQRGFIRLDLTAERLRWELLTTLVKEETLYWVEELRLEKPQPHCLSLLADSHLLQHVCTLDLSNNHLADRGLTSLLHRPGVQLGGLRTLRLSGNRIGSRGTTLLAGSPGLKRLHLLDLTGNRVGDAGARALAESLHLGELRRLLISGNGVNPEGLFALRERFGTKLEIAW